MPWVSTGSITITAYGATKEEVAAIVERALARHKTTPEKEAQVKVNVQIREQKSEE